MKHSRAVRRALAFCERLAAQIQRSRRLSASFGAENAPRRVSLARGHRHANDAANSRPRPRSWRRARWRVRRLLPGGREGPTSTRTSVALDSSALRKSSAAQRTAQPARSEVERPRRYGLEVKRAWERPACAIADDDAAAEEERTGARLAWTPRARFCEGAAPSQRPHTALFSRSLLASIQR